MGKVFGKNASKLISILITCMLLSAGIAEASYREFQLFDRAYHFYLSYQPEKAIQQFRVFLEEFPESSAQDAGLFWLAKSLLQVESVDEARKTFTDVRQRFPESPFSRYVTAEMALIDNTADVRNFAQIPEDSKGENPNGAKKSLAVSQRSIGERGQREKYIVNSAAVLDSLGIHDVLWRSNNILEDIENEQILYDEAKSLDIAADSAQLSALIEMYEFNEEQADYLNRYLVICRFLTIMMNYSPDEKLVESLTVSYKMFPDTGDGAAALSLLASELQKCARSGMSLDDIHAAYPEGTEYRRIRISDLEYRMKEKIRTVHDAETGIFWTEEGFMIVRIISKNLMCDPFDYRQSIPKTTIRMFMEELKAHYGIEK